MNNNEPIISIDSIIDKSENDDFSPAPEVTADNSIQVIKDKRTERIQIGLIIFLIVIASLVYFFGYDFLKPFIKVD